MKLLGALLTTALLLAGCGSAGGEDTERSGLPDDDGPLPTDTVLWATGDSIHVGDRTVAVGRPVRAMVGARGRIYYLTDGPDTLWVTDGDKNRRTGYQTDALRASSDGRYLGFLDQSDGFPWSTVVVDLSNGEVVVHDAYGMGDEDDDYADLYEDAEPHVLGFADDELYVQAASGNDVLSWNLGSGKRTDHGGELFLREPDPGGGRSLPALVQKGRLVVPDDPYLSTFWGHESPDGSVTIQPVGNRTDLFAVEGGQRLPVDFHGRRFLLGGWIDPGTAYGVSFDRSPRGTVRLVGCRLTLEERRCRVLRTIDPPGRGLVLFPTGSPAQDY